MVVAVVPLMVVAVVLLMIAMVLMIWFVIWMTAEAVAVSHLLFTLQLVCPRPRLIPRL